MGFTFFHRPKPKQFKYTPLYYDEKKEALQEALKSANNEQSFSEIRFRKTLEHSWDKRNSRRAKRVTSMRLFTILLLIVGLIYFILFF